jgi:hypothetical protein
MEINNILIVSSIFGKIFTKTYKAPLNKNCIFFTNNETLKDEIVNNGWTYIFIDFELTDDFTVSSLQSKYIKFLIFLEKFPEFKKFSNIIYTDHKFQLLDSHIQKLHNIYISNPTEIIIIRKTPKNKTNIFDEINEAKFQERYLKNMNETIEFVQNKIDTGEINSDIRISNTGIIYYNNFTQIIPFLNNIYNTCMELQQPECQIFWAVYCQKYLNYINQIEFNEVNPIWKEP